MLLLLKTPALASAATALTYAQEVAADSPLLWWRMGEPSGNLADSSGNGHTGTVSGTVTYGTSGAVAGNNAITGNGSTGRVVSSTTLDLSSFSTVTFEFWANVSAYVTNKHFISTGTANAQNKSIAIWATDATTVLCRSINATSGANGRQFTTVPATGSWHHWVCTWFQTGGWTVRIDKVDQSLSVNGSSTPTALDNIVFNAFIRGDNFGNSAYAMDEIAVYGGTLSNARSDAHYDAASV